MQEQDFPALYKSADDISLEAQRNFFFALKLHLILLVVAAILSITNISHWLVAVLQLLSLLGALSCSIYLFNSQPDRLWYASRAVAESIKTITWRYVCRAEPFQCDDETAKSLFKEKLRAVVDQNKEIVQSLKKYLGEPQITDAMVEMRLRQLGDRKSTYKTKRIRDQLDWYKKKAIFNRRTSALFFVVLIAINVVAVICAALRIKFADISFWPTDVLVAVAASLLSWMQAKRFSELAASYALAAYEIGLIYEKSLEPFSENEFSLFISDSENAFSREHTQWTARRDT